ncbi:MAG: M23 family metallopeptidase [Bryobacterales bacterium]|nr:M23 family metallopeptidase [Bryobacterales bacterium]
MPRFIYAAMVTPDPGTFPEMVPPVPELAPGEVQDSYFSARSGYRAHRAIDISRVTGTPLVAVVDGFIEKMTSSRLGGTCLYIVDTERRYRFFYAHLSAYAEGVTEGMPVLRGQVVGYVGATGNARFTGPHLHFQILVVNPDSTWSSDLGTVNPYPLLRGLVTDGIQAELAPVQNAPLAMPAISFSAGPTPLVAPEFSLPASIEAEAGQN